VISDHNSNGREIFHNSLDSHSRERKDYHSVGRLDNRYDLGLQNCSSPRSKDICCGMSIFFSLLIVAERTPQDLMLETRSDQYMVNE